MKGRPVSYSADELAWIEANSTRLRKEAHADFVATWDRQDVSIGAFQALCQRNGWTTGRKGFEKGHTPTTKGRKLSEEHRAKLSASWKPGERRGAAALKLLPIGTERLTDGGYLERKVRNDGPRAGRWRRVHILNWEAVHGPVPEDHCLKCLSDDKLNVDPDNWEAVPRGCIPRLIGGRWGQSYHEYEPEVRPVLMALARLQHAARNRA